MKFDRETRHKLQTIGGSDAPTIFGLTTRTQGELQREKLFGEVTLEQTLLMELGIHMEPFILKLYERQTGVKTIRTGKILRSKRFPWMHVSTDAYAQNDKHPLEVKMTVFPRFGDWGEEHTDQIPDNYLCQCMHNLAVTEADYIEVPVFIYGKLRIYRIEADQDFIVRLADAEHEWYSKHIILGEPVADFKAKWPMLPIESTPALLLTETEEMFLDRYKELNEMISGLQKLQEEAKNTILARLGTASAAVGPSGLMVERKQYENKGYQVEPFTVQRIYIKQLTKLKKRIHERISNQERKQLATGNE